MAVKTNNLILYHLPKSGGIAAKEAVRASLRDKSVYGRCRSSGARNDFGMYREHATPDGTLDKDKQGRLSVCFVRNPVSWYQSFWAFRIKSQGYDPRFPLDDLMDEKIDRFVQNVFTKFPDGFLYKLYQLFVGEDLSKINFIGKQESLAEDLIQAMTLAGEDFDADIIRNRKWLNIAAHGRKYKPLVKLNPAMVGMILEKEDWIVQTFYNDV